MTQHVDGQWYWLDPDFRKDPTTKIFCSRCQKPLGNTWHRGVVDWDNHRIRFDPKGDTYIGTDCYRKIVSMPVATRLTDEE
jgi:hypothetical protein